MAAVEYKTASFRCFCLGLFVVYIYIYSLLFIASSVNDGWNVRHHVYVLWLNTNLNYANGRTVLHQSQL